MPTVVCGAGGSRKRQLAEVRDRLERLRPEFENAATYALDNPDDPHARAALDRVLRELEAAGRNMDRVLPPPSPSPRLDGGGGGDILPVGG